MVTGSSLFCSTAAGVDKPPLLRNPNHANCNRKEILS